MKHEELKFNPVNSSERLQYAMYLRLDALCHMMDSLVEHIATRDNVATTTHQVVEEVVETVQEKPKKKTKK